MNMLSFPCYGGAWTQITVDADPELQFSADPE